MGKGNKGNQPSQPNELGPSPEVQFKDGVAKLKKLGATNSRKATPAPATGDDRPRPRRRAAERMEGTQTAGTSFEEPEKEKEPIEFGSFKNEVRAELNRSHREMVLWLIGTLLASLLATAGITYAQISGIKSDLKDQLSESRNDLNREVDHMSESHRDFDQRLRALEGGRARRNDSPR